MVTASEGEIRESAAVRCHGRVRWPLHHPSGPRSGRANCNQGSGAGLAWLSGILPLGRSFGICGSSTLGGRKALRRKAGADQGIEAGGQSYPVAADRILTGMRDKPPPLRAGKDNARLAERAVSDDAATGKLSRTRPTPGQGESNAWRYERCSKALGPGTQPYRRRKPPSRPGGVWVPRELGGYYQHARQGPLFRARGRRGSGCPAPPVLSCHPPGVSCSSLAGCGEPKGRTRWTLPRGAQAQPGCEVSDARVVSNPPCRRRELFASPEPESPVSGLGRMSSRWGTPVRGTGDRRGWPPVCPERFSLTPQRCGPYRPRSGSSAR